MIRENMNSRISISDVSHGFGEAHTGKSNLVLTDISLDFSEGQFVSIVGPSGCGKSTLLRIIGGLVKPLHGHVNFFESQPKTAMVFQKPTLLPWLNVEQNIVFPAKHQTGRVSDQDYSVSRDLLERTSLTQYAKESPTILSGGMQQKVAIARALFLDPDVLLMDETIFCFRCVKSRKDGNRFARNIESDEQDGVVYHTLNSRSCSIIR